MPEPVAAWGTPDFDTIAKKMIESLPHDQLPLQQGLAQSSYVSESPFSVIILTSTETADMLRIKAGVFYNGIIAGSCCADDPTPVDEQTEYCELQFDIDKNSAQVMVVLIES
jgi:hypothetical protein